MNIRDRYLGSALGLFWAVLHPLLLLGIYTFVFGFVLKSKLPGAETTFAYSIWMISGFVPYMAFSDAINVSTSSVIGGSGLVKNIVFKSETLPIAATLTAGVPFTVGMIFLMFLLFADGNYPTWHIVALVPVIILQFAFLTGAAFFLSATTVFIRDIAQALPTLIMFLLFFTPIFYPVESMPQLIEKLTFFNPLYQMTRPYRDILFQHQLPDWRGMAYLGFLATVLILSGLKYFRRLKGYFEMKL
ncbi:MAG: ABC transporter permease [Nitrospirae bacterium]|nr:ABC transporter permease [Nitrospirota bacterium]